MTIDVAKPEPGAPERDEPNETPVAGIAASAEGVDALVRMLRHADQTCGIAFVVVADWDDAQNVAASDRLSQAAALPVALAPDGQEIEPNHVYLAPTGRGVVIRDNCLHLASLGTEAEPQGVIDVFFTSLARNKAEKAACVILAGIGSDGTLGLRAIKESDGLAIAQAGAAYHGMMHAAIAAGTVDAILPPEEIAAKLTEYFCLAHADERAADEPGASTGLRVAIPAITTLLRASTGHDFSGYKDCTIIRRLQRRMHVLQISDVNKFTERLRSDPNEVKLLFQDLLIGVTEFFRDRDAFMALRDRVIPDLFKDKGHNDAIRVWVPGCSTGEEAYSIAILLREHASGMPHAPRMQIFASDIDERALKVARTGRYPVSISKDLPPELLTRYFVREDGSYRISSELRELCLFSSHNILRDAPFSKQDLISCRNLLIYLGTELQAQVIPLFHYALNPNGFLFLGTSENVTRHSRLFATIDKTHRIFQRRSSLERRVPEFPLSTPEISRRGAHYRPLRGPAEPTLRSVAERYLLERFVPAYVVVNADGDLVQTSGRTGKYLELPPGAPDTNLFSMARIGLRLELRAALHRAVASGQLATQAKVAVETDAGRQQIQLSVQPMRFGDPAETYYMIVFQDLGPPQPEEVQPLEADQDATGIGIRQLEAELRTTREKLQATTEELESSNEELSSINEELQLANEELETSKEELQSINEELHTVNSELNARVEELTRAYNDMSNLLDSTRIATIFLDRRLQVKGFTPAAKDVFRLVESDTGRPITHVRPRFEIENLPDDLERVLRTLSSIERPVKSTEGDRLYMMRLLPYRTMDNVIDGVVLTFVDITRITEAEAKVRALTRDLHARIEELETIIDLVPVGLVIARRADSETIMVNQHGARLLGLSAGHKGLVPANTSFRVFQNGVQLGGADMPLQRALRTGQPVPVIEARLERADGTSVEILMSATPLFDGESVARGALAAIVDISAQKALEAHQRVLLEELQHRVKNTLATVASLARRISRRAQTITEFQDSFLPRLAAMGRTHDLLSGGAWAGADLRPLLLVALAPHADPERMNITVSGDKVTLTPNAATMLGMVFHELATNAARHGALTNDQGVVNVSWQVKSSAQQEKNLHIAWRESNGPSNPSRDNEGFGLNFVRRSIGYELEGSVETRFDDSGFSCDIEFPLKGNVE